MTAKVLNPFLTSKLAELLISTVQVLLPPVLFGVFLNQYFHNVVNVVFPIITLIAFSVVSILYKALLPRMLVASIDSVDKLCLRTWLVMPLGFSLVMYFQVCLGSICLLQALSQMSVSLSIFCSRRNLEKYPSKANLQDKPSNSTNPPNRFLQGCLIVKDKVMKEKKPHYTLPLELALLWEKVRRQNIAKEENSKSISEAL